MIAECKHPVFPGQNAANAALIVRAVNSHASDQRKIAELREALADLYRDEKLDDDDPRLIATRTKVAALLARPAHTEGQGDKS